MRILLLLLLLAISKAFLSQDSLKAYVVFRTKHVIAYLDDKKITPSHDIIYLKKGMHQIKAWAPGYKLLQDSFMVEKNKTLYSRRLHHNGAYRVFVAKRWLKGISTVIPVSLTVLYTLRLNSRLNDKLNFMNSMSYNRMIARMKADSDPDNNGYSTRYNQSIFAYKTAKLDYTYNKRNGIITASVLGAASLAYIIFSCTYKVKSKEKTLLSRMTPGIDPWNKQICLRLQL